MAESPQAAAGLEGLDGPVTRRRVLRGLGRFGLAATATAGIAGLLGARPADAATTATAPTGTGFPPQTVVPPPCGCKTLCSLNEGHCGGCASGQCYHCNGCGLDGNICLTGCNAAPTCYWCT
jgi:hypothetical protein